MPYKSQREWANHLVVGLCRETVWRRKVVSSCIGFNRWNLMHKGLNGRGKCRKNWEWEFMGRCGWIGIRAESDFWSLAASQLAQTMLHCNESHSWMCYRAEWGAVCKKEIIRWHGRTATKTLLCSNKPCRGPSLSCTRLQRWSIFRAMRCWWFIFQQRCDTDYFLERLNIDALPLLRLFLLTIGNDYF